MQLVVLAGVGDAEALGKAVAEVVGCTALQCNAVVHHRLDCIGSLCTCELFLLGFLTDYRRDSQCLGIKIAVNLEHFEGFFLGFLSGGVHCVAFLPEEFRGAKERTGCLFPSYDRAPLVVELGQVAVGVDYLFIMLAEKRFGCGADGEALGELFLTADCYPRTFGSEALDVILFLLEKAFGDKHRHIDILVACLLKAPVHIRLHKLPDCIAVGADYHAALYARIINELSLFYYIGVPFCKVLVAAGDSLDHFFVVSHIYSSKKVFYRNISIIL